MMNEPLSRVLQNWMTETDVPDPSPLPEIPGWSVLIRPVSVKRKTKGGIIVPDSSMDALQYLMTVARVLVIGDMAYKHEDIKAPWCKVGDFISYPKTGPIRFTYKGVKLALIRDTDVIFKLNDPADLDPHYQI